MIESRSTCLVRLSSTFCKNGLGTAAREEKVDPALFGVGTNVALVSILSTFAFFINFTKSEYVTFSMVRGPRPFSGVRKALLL